MGEPKDQTALITQCLESGLSLLRGRDIRVREVTRELLQEGFSFSVERLRLRLQDGEALEVLFKDLDPRSQRPDAQKVRGPELERGRRELQVYRDILARYRLGTPELYACRWDPEAGRFWLFLEFVRARRLSDLGAFHLWLATARWAARFHAAILDLPSGDTESLAVYDHDHFASCSRQFEEKLARIDPAYRGLVRRALDHYPRVADRLASLSRCLIHGELYSNNVMIRDGDPLNRVAVLDWETAAVGPRYLDVASLSAGHWTLRQRKAMWEAYRGEFLAQTGIDVDEQDFHRDMAAASLHNALHDLAWWAEGDPSHIGLALWELERVLAFWEGDVPMRKQLA